MARIPLFGGAYKSRSILASAQRSVNIFPELTPPAEEPPTPIVQLLTPGLTRLATPPSPGAGRGLYRASDGTLFAVIGDGVYTISSSWAFTLLGTIGTSANPVSMKDNEQTMFLVDGSATGYTVTLGTNTLDTVTDPNYQGADRVDYLDTFLLFNKPNTPEFYSTLSNVVDFDPLYFANLTGEPTNVVAAVTLHGYIWVIGERATEIWFDAGDTNVFPFARTPSQVLQQGCVAKYSVSMSAGDDDGQSAVLWLSSNEDGAGIALKSQNFQSVRVSTHAIEEEWRKYPTLTDAQAFCYQQGGHQFYMLTFPAADKTWCLDLTTGEWHERVYIDMNGAEHRHRAGCSAYAFGANICLDWQEGTLYKFDLDNFTDDGVPIVRRRGFPHLVSDGKRVIYSRFIADMQTGEDQSGESDAYFPPQISLRYSDDHGRSWGNPVMLNGGEPGAFAVSMMATRLGMARDRVFELYWAEAMLTSLNGAFVETIPLAS